MLVFGILFLILGFITILEQRYTIKKVGKKRYMEEKTVDNRNYLNRYKTLLGIFSIVLGILSILNYIIY